MRQSFALAEVDALTSLALAGERTELKKRNLVKKYRRGDKTFSDQSRQNLPPPLRKFCAFEKFHIIIKITFLSAGLYFIRTVTSWN